MNKNISWAPEVMVTGENKWSRNSLRFATEEEAYASAHELAMRWILVTDWRAVPTEEPVNYRLVDGQLQAVEE